MDGLLCIMTLSSHLVVRDSPDGDYQELLVIGIDGTFQVIDDNSQDPTIDLTDSDRIELPLIHSGGIVDKYHQLGGS